MSQTTRHARSTSLKTLPTCLMAVLITVAACASPPPPPLAPYTVKREGDLRGAARQLAEDLSKQSTLDAEDRTIVIDPILDGKTGQQTVLSTEFESELATALAEFIKPVTLLPFDEEGAKAAHYVLAAEVIATDTISRFTANASITNLKTGLVAGSSSALFRKPGADRSPTKFYRESPSLVRDRTTDGYLRTTKMRKGAAADSLYVSQIPTAGLLAEGIAAYNSSQYDKALNSYNAAAARPDGEQQLRTFNGVYLSNAGLNRANEAENAFAKIAAIGIATNNLAVKILFTPGTVDFWPGREYAGVYPMWVRQIAKAAAGSRRCLDVVGHTSRSGTEELNDKLSLNRAETVRKMMSTAEPSLANNRLKAIGMGFRQNIAGTGLDNAGDAIDRRVEFKTVNCTP